MRRYEPCKQIFIAAFKWHGLLKQCIYNTGILNLLFVPLIFFFMDRTVFEKRSTDRLVFLLTVSEMDVQFYYGVQTGQNFSITIKTAGHLQKGQWTHVALQVGCILLLCCFHWPVARSRTFSKGAMTNFWPRHHIPRYITLFVAELRSCVFGIGPKAIKHHNLLHQTSSTRWLWRVLILVHPYSR